MWMQVWGPVFCSLHQIKEEEEKKKNTHPIRFLLSWSYSEIIITFLLSLFLFWCYIISAFIKTVMAVIFVLLMSLISKINVACPVLVTFMLVCALVHACLSSITYEVQTLWSRDVLVSTDGILVWEATWCREKNRRLWSCTERMWIWFLCPWAGTSLWSQALFSTQLGW